MASQSTISVYSEFDSGDLDELYTHHLTQIQHDDPQVLLDDSAIAIDVNDAAETDVNDAGATDVNDAEATDVNDAEVTDENNTPAVNDNVANSGQQNNEPDFK